MPVDVLIFALIALFLALRLKSVLGTRTGDERPQPNPYAVSRPTPAPAVTLAARPAPSFSEVEDEAVAAGLAEIATADASFTLDGFLTGARAAYAAVVAAYRAGDRETLRPLVSPRLLQDLEAAFPAAPAPDSALPPQPASARVVSAHLGGVMAYIAVAFETAADADAPAPPADVWTFSRDVRSPDPNWTLISTRPGDKA